MGSSLRIRACRIAAACLCGFALWWSGIPAPAEAADAYPARPVRLIVPFGAGAATDIVARIFAAKLGDTLGQTIVVDNRPGAAGMIGTDTAAKAAPDGYTLLVFGINQTITPALQAKLPYDSIRDFAHVSLYGTLPNILVIHPSVPATSVKEFVALAKAAPGSMRYGSSGIGASPHLTMELFKSRTGVDLVHVPYKVAAQGITELVAGHLHAWFNNLPSAIGHVRAGRVRALAVTSVKRAEQLPEVPTMIESGLPDFEVTVWQGVAVPRATSRAVVSRLHGAMVEALAAPELKRRFSEQGVAAVSTTGEEFLAFIKTETAKWARVVKESGVKIE